VYESVVGDHVPSFAVNVSPTFLVPVIVGIGSGVANVPAATTTVVADVFGVSPLPDFCHVTVALTKRVRSSAVNT
jgi:hypothetical protein